MWPFKNKQMELVNTRLASLDDTLSVLNENVVALGSLVKGGGGVPASVPPAPQESNPSEPGDDDEGLIKNTAIDKQKEAYDQLIQKALKDPSHAEQYLEAAKNLASLFRKRRRLEKPWSGGRPVGTTATVMAQRREGENGERQADTYGITSENFPDKAMEAFDGIKGLFHIPDKIMGFDARKQIQSALTDDDFKKDVGSDPEAQALLGRILKAIPKPQPGQAEQVKAGAATGEEPLVLRIDHA